MFFPDSSTLYIPPFSPFFRLPTTRRIYSVYTFDLSFFIHVRSITGRLRRRYNFEDDETTGNQETEKERKREQEIKKKFGQSAGRISENEETWRDRGTRLFGLHEAAASRKSVKFERMQRGGRSSRMSAKSWFSRKRNHARRSCSSLTISRKSSSRNKRSNSVENER